LGYKTAPDAAVVTRCKAYINQTQREILSMKGMSSLRRAIVPFDSVATIPYAVLPQCATRIISVVDRTGAYPLSPVSVGHIQQADPSFSSTSGTPGYFAVINLASAVARNPLAAAELFVKSDSASDTSTKEVFVEGIVTGGYPRSASVALNGVTAVSLGATITTWIQVNKFYLTLAAGGVSTAAGNVTLHSISGAGLELSRISIGRAYPRYTRIQLWPTPSAAVTYHAEIELHIEDMAESNDEPYLPEDFHWLLGSGALLKEYQRKEQPAMVAIERGTYEDGLGNLKLYVARAVGTPPVERPRFSQLGPWYSAGS
jgi:hypothetical protein